MAGLPSSRAHVAVALGCVFLTACGGPVERVEPRRDVVVVLIDTLRADFVGISGRAPYPVTPELDRLARRGRWCDQAWSSAPWTPPSVMSIMTSLEPPVHGLDLAADRLAERVPGLPAGAATMAELFRAAGYRTLAVTAGGGVGSVYGFDRGFERFYEPAGQPDSDVEAGVDRALAWLAAADPRPTFLFFHTYEVHLPNTHPPAAEATAPAERAVAAYAGDLAVADRHLGRLFAALAADGGLDRSLVVVTSDHGENLYDRALGDRPVDHGHHLHAELLRVPLIVVAPGLIPPAGPVSGPVQLLDVLPTVCSLVGIALDGVPHQGRDLAPALLGRGRVEPPPPAWFAWAPLQGPSWGAVRTSEWAYLRSPRIDTDQWWGRVEPPPRAIYRRDDDPDERTNVAADNPAELDALEALLADRAAADRALRAALGAPGAVAVDGEDALRELGYLDPAPAAGD